MQVSVKLEGEGRERERKRESECMHFRQDCCHSLANTSDSATFMMIAALITQKNIELQPSNDPNSFSETFPSN